MKKVWLLVGVLMVAAPAWADWTHFARSDADNSDWYMDRNAPRSSNSQIKRAWVLKDMKTPDKDGDVSAKALYEFDCAEERYRTLQVTYYKGKMGGGAESGGMKRPNEWAYAPPNSIVESGMQATCGKSR